MTKNIHTCFVSMLTITVSKLLQFMPPSHPSSIWRDHPSMFMTIPRNMSFNIENYYGKVNHKCTLNFPISVGHNNSLESTLFQPTLKSNLSLATLIVFGRKLTWMYFSFYVFTKKNQDDSMFYVRCWLEVSMRDPMSWKHFISIPTRN